MAVRPAGAPLEMRLHIDASLRTNAVYHLACLGGSISCSRDIFERFWKDRLHESVDDRQTVAAWQRLLASAGERAPEMKPSPLLINAIRCTGWSDATSGDCWVSSKRDRLPPSNAVRPC